MSTSDRTEIQDDDEREDARRLSLQGNDPPSEIEGYTIIRRLGTGAYGTVWLAREDHTGRMVAIKFYPHRRGLNWSLLNREVEKLATLYASRNIVRLLDVGWNAEPPYYVMEFVENGSLGAYLAGGAAGVEETVRITQQVCGALIEAHGAGVLHCDLKPDNVLLDAQFQVRLCDFGQSRMSHEQSSALGTLYYMAPEQADLEAIPDARWDVYAVGALVYHMLTGQPPYRAPAIQQKLELAESLPERLKIYQQYIRDAPAPDLHHSIKGVDKHLASVVDQCLAVDPRERLPNAQAVLSQLASRERNRTRRPLLLLGVLGPILLMCAMVPIFVGALRENIRDLEVQLIEGVQDSNALTARSQANSLQEELENRLWGLEQFVVQEDIIRILADLMDRDSDDVVANMKQFHDAPNAERPEWMQRLDAARAASDELNANKSPDTSWFLTDVTGRQLWRRPFSEKTIGENYIWRDYFHGTNVKYSRENAPAGLKPIQEAHVSLPFISEETNRYMVALSVPVRSKDGRVIGVVARTLHLGALQRRLGQDIQGDESESISRVVALADRRDSRLLDHPWLTSETLQDSSTAEAEMMFQQLRLPQDLLQKIEAKSADFAEDAAPEAHSRRIDIRDNSYFDPVGQVDASYANEHAGGWIAAISTMRSKKMPWLVIVQEDKDRALKPVREMGRRAIRQVLYAVFASLVTMGGIWLFVWQALVRAQDPKPRRGGELHQAS